VTRARKKPTRWGRLFSYLTEGKESHISKRPVEPDSRKAMKEGIRKMASEHKTTHFCDLYTALANEDGLPKPEYFAADKLHMNDAGHTKWAELLSPIFEKLKLQ